MGVLLLKVRNKEALRNRAGDRFMSALTKKVIREITHRKVRSLLTIVGIAIGIIGFSAVSVASSQFSQSLAYSSNVTVQPDLQIYTEPTRSNLAQILQSQPNVKTVQPRGSIVTRWQIGQDSKLIQILGIPDFQTIKIGKFQLVEGKLPGANEIVLETGARTFADVQIGDTISIQAGKNYRNVKISGFVQTQGLAQASIGGKAWGYMDEPDFEGVFMRAGVTDFAIQINNYGQLYQTLDQLSNVIEAQHIKMTGSDVGRDTSVSDIANGLFQIMDLLSLIAILLSIILLVGTITSLIAEQIQAIGTMKAIGGGRGQIMRHYLALVTMYAVIGTVLGLVIGILAGYALSKYLGGLVSLNIGPLQVSPTQLLTGLAIGIVTPLLAALIPVLIGTRITVRQALSGYGVENNASAGRGLWSKFTRAIFGTLPQTMQYGMRNMFRKRLRSVLTLVTLAIAGAALLAVQTANFSFNNFLNQVYDTYHFDVSVSISDPIAQSTFQQILSTVPGIKRIEGINQDNATTNWGNAALTGVQPDTQIYHKDLVAGRWFSSSDPDNVVIISKDAADKSGLKVGNTVSFNVGRYKASWHIIGITRDYSQIGPGNFGVLLTTLTQMNRLEQFPDNYVQEVMIQSTNKAPSQAYLDDLSRKVDNAMSAAGYLPDVQTPQDLIAQAQSKYQILYTLFDVVTIVIAIVGAVGLSNALMMSVLERRREIGILRSIGAVGRKVAQVFWTEGISIGLSAWVLALVLGIPAAYGFVQLQGRLLAPVPFAFNPMNMFVMLVVIIILAILASIGPVYAAMRVKIIQTLRYE
jgi:putative ABC transport system permease protein